MIVPAILTDKRKEFMRMLNLCGEFAEFVQIDVMDGKFVPSMSISPDDLEGLKSPLRCEAHIMADDPLNWVIPFKDFGAQRIVFHFEIKKDKNEVIRNIRETGLKAGLAVNPNTKIEEFSSFVDKVDSILFMSVVPGFYGASFIPGVLDKIKKFKELYPRKETGIDGGVKLGNIEDVKRAGLSYICVGSAILKAPSPQEAYNSFLEEYNK